MQKLFSVALLASLGVALSGCFWQRTADIDYMAPEVTIEEAMDAAELTSEQAETQMLSNDDELETIGAELDATVILDEDLSNL